MGWRAQPNNQEGHRFANAARTTLGARPAATLARSGVSKIPDSLAERAILPAGPSSPRKERPMVTRLETGLFALVASALALSACGAEGDLTTDPDVSVTSSA